MANEEMWDKLFKRVDSFKAVLKPTKADARDAFILAYYELPYIFALTIRFRNSEARKIKDDFVEELRQRGLSRKRLQTISKVLTEACELVEKTKET